MSPSQVGGADAERRPPISLDCRIWLGQRHEGRLGYLSGRGPQSVVVTYALIGDQILLRVPEYNDITQYAPGARVSLAVDGQVEPRSLNQPEGTIDAITVTGIAALTAEGDRRSVAAALFEESWPAGVRTRTVSLPLTELEVREREPRGSTALLSFGMLHRPLAYRPAAGPPEPLPVRART